MPLTNYECKFLPLWHHSATLIKEGPLEGESSSLDLHPRAQFAPARHPLTLKCGESAVCELLAQRAIHYDRSTATLETEAVIPEVTNFHKGSFDLKDGAILRESACQVLIDEGAHALNAAHVESIMRGFGITPIQLPRPFFFEKLDRERENASENKNRLSLFAYCFSTETLISGTLSQIPHDKTVHPLIREEIRRHGIDEARHHAFYRQRFAQTWPSLTKAEQNLMTRLIPCFIRAFLEPDLPAVRCMLRHIGLNKAESDIVIAECYPPNLVNACVFAGAAKTVSYCVEAGVLADPDYAANFMAAGLL